MTEQSTKPDPESVWDYPRPPRLEASSRVVRIELNGVELAKSCRTYRVLETSHPPVYYLPPEDIDLQRFQLMERRTFCEWKGVACYYSIQVGDRMEMATAWFYPEPTESFHLIQNYVAFYPSRMDACWLDD